MEFNREGMEQVFIRTCQECGHQQKDVRPKGEPTNAFCDRKCKKCGSESLDFGSEQWRKKK